MKAQRTVERIVDLAASRPWAVLAAAVALLATLGFVARGLELRADLAELLPKDSPGFQALVHQSARAGGSSSLILIVASPERDANVRFVEALGDELGKLAARRPDLVAHVEEGTREARAFYAGNKWLYADLGELEETDEELERRIAQESGLVEDLGDHAPKPSSSAAPAPHDSLGLRERLARWRERADTRDPYPTGWFEARNGTLFGVRIASRVALGGPAGDVLLGEVHRIVDEIRARGGFPPSLQVGFTGDVASAAGEKRALLDEAAVATGIAIVVVLASIVVFFRTPWSLLVIGIPVAVGVASAYAFAKVAFGHVNAAGAFLGAIIVGNGINYPIVLLARYQDFRTNGMPADEARRTAVVNALRAELVGACVAAIAYGSLSLTEFRGFRQFGLVGFVGMLLVWASIVPLVPALVTLVERAGATFTHRPSRARVALERFALLVTARPRTVVTAGVLLTVALAYPAVRWLADPWEYDLGKLGSRSSDVSGAGDWSDKANEVFGGKANIAGAMMVADHPEQVPEVAAKIRENDAHDPQGKLVADVVTVDDALPGDPALQARKLAVLERIRERLTPKVLESLDPDDRRTALEAKPPENLHVLRPGDLPLFVRRKFTDRDGVVGTVFYVKPREDVVFADGRVHLRMSKTTDNIRLADGTIVRTASRSTLFAELLASLRRDGPRLTAVSLGAVALVVVLLSRSRRVALPVLAALGMGVVWFLGTAALLGERLGHVSFIALPITFGIGCEYPFNVADRARLLAGDARAAVVRSGGAVLLCSFTTIVGYGSLLLSDFQSLATFGRLAVLGEVACMTAALVVLPPLLRLVAPKAGPAEPARPEADVSGRVDRLRLVQ